MKNALLCLAMLAGLATAAAAQDHTEHMQHMQQTPVVAEPGQSAFAAIQEIVGVLQADPEVNWSRVDIDALRAHLVDMDNVTLRAQVETHPLVNGAEFRVNSEDPAVRASIQAMVTAHAAVMNGSGELQQEVSPIANGAILRVSGDADARARILGLGFFGILSLGMHHQDHHLAMARGEAPHVHGSE
ncbi:hypothetical protein [Tropicimonas sp. IMCC6043]|uniref:hypothetical protein n=1 Tax=Tropicimonas sp. IMCC6043 TaxID=2510645 RepID=UPI00101D2388|nr:hypothetical protein [Tropicimonas sp. IMCC6043]RYH06001.1 hypothetical protein EU800_25345 [Tropicimonas sp. IMCC6043]